MLASNGMRLARELRSPLTPALAPAPARRSSSPATRATRRSRGSAIAALVLAGVLFATRAPPDGLVALVPLARARGLVRALDRVVDRARPELELREPHASSTSPSRSSARSSARDAAPAPLRLLDRCSAPSASGRSPARCCPWLYEDYGRIARLRGPVGYWNALALLGDIALPIGLCLATRRADGRDAARLRLDRRDRADLLARRRARRDRRRRALDAALARLDRVALDAGRGRAARGRRARGRLRARRASRATASRTPRASTPGIVFGVVLAVDALIAVGARPLPAAARDGGRGGSRSPCSRSRSPPSVGGRRRARALVVELVHDARPAPELTNSPGAPRLRRAANFRWSWWQQAWKGFEQRAARRAPAPARSRCTNLRYRTTSLDQTIEPHDLPAPVPERDRGRRRSSLFARLGRAGSSSAGGADPGRSSRSRSRCPRTSCTGCSTSTGTSSRCRRPCS